MNFRSWFSFFSFNFSLEIILLIVINESDLISFLYRFLRIFRSIDKSINDEELIREFARESDAIICPTCAVFGGIASQEVLKSISGKFTQILQFLAIGNTSSLPKDCSYELKNDRYDPYR